MNDIVRIKIDDIVERDIHEVNGVDPFVRTVKISIDPFSFFQDYLALSLETDVMGHTAL